MHCLPIIGGKEDKSVVSDASFNQSVQHLPHAPVQLTEGVTKGSTDARVGEELAGKLWLVGVLEGQVEEEWCA